MKIQDLIWDEVIYPRSSLNQKTVDAYAERLKEMMQNSADSTDTTAS